MASYEFCFPISPRTGRSWPKKLPSGGFEVEVANDELLLRTETTAVSVDKLKHQTETVAASLIQAMSFEEKQPLTGVLARIVKTSPGEPTATSVFLSDKMNMWDHVESVKASH
jgi:hypothetical protein